MLNQFTFETANDYDIPELKTLGVLAYQKFEHYLTAENWLTMKSGLQNAYTYLNLLKISTGFVCKHNQQIIGMAFMVISGNETPFFSKDWSYIRLVGVNPAFEGKGIGRKLTEMCLNTAIKNGEKFMALHSAEFQKPAQHIYETLGFIKQKEFTHLGAKYWLYLLQVNN